ncbi:MAG: hypothetical protein ACO1ON_16910 [Nocardioides sp.]
MILPPYAADLVVPIAWGVVGLLLAALLYALLRGRRGTTSATDTVPDPAGPHGPGVDPANPVEPAAPTATPSLRPPATLPATPPATTAAPAGAWDQGQPAPEPVASAVSPGPSPLLEVPRSPEPTPDVREMRVLRRQVDVLTRTLAEWEQVRVVEPGQPPASTPPEAVAPTPTPPAPLGPVARPSLPGAAYLDLSRRLAERGDLDGAVLAQWACDLEVLRGPLAGHEGDLATAVAAVSGDDPVVVLRGCREAALALVAVAGPVRTLLAPLDHLVQAAADPATRVPSAGFPAELVELAPEADRPALSALVAGQQS